MFLLFLNKHFRLNIFKQSILELFCLGQKCYIGSRDINCFPEQGWSKKVFPGETELESHG